MVTDFPSKKSILAQAKEEFEKEQVQKAVKMLKAKLKEKAAAQLVLDNIEREIQDLEDRIEQGDIE